MMITVIFKNFVAVGYVNGTVEDAKRVVAKDYDGDWKLACRASNVEQIYTFKEIKEMA